MKFDPVHHHRRSIRLKGYDYSQPGAYFVTICIHSGECILGEIVNGQVRISPAGEIVKSAWLDLPGHYPNVLLDEFCVMPNHVHGIIVLTEWGYRIGRGGSVSDGALKPSKKQAHSSSLNQHGLPEIVRAFKSFSARRINSLRCTQGNAVWQRNYYEHIIRNEAEWDLIHRYIRANPLQWEFDSEYPR